MEEEGRGEGGRWQRSEKIKGKKHPNLHVQLTTPYPNWVSGLVVPWLWSRSQAPKFNMYLFSDVGVYQIVLWNIVI